MSSNPLRLKIAYLYPDILQSFCDKANVEVFCKRAAWRDVDIQVYEINANDKISASKFDFYYIGGSNTSAMENALKYLYWRTYAEIISRIYPGKEIVFYLE